jgi:hypothetical protein
MTHGGSDCWFLHLTGDEGKLSWTQRNTLRARLTLFNSPFVRLITVYAVFVRYDIQSHNFIHGSYRLVPIVWSPDNSVFRAGDADFQIHILILPGSTCTPAEAAPRLSFDVNLILHLSSRDLLPSLALLTILSPRCNDDLWFGGPSPHKKALTRRPAPRAQRVSIFIIAHTKEQITSRKCMSSSGRCRQYFGFSILIGRSGELNTTWNHAVRWAEKSKPGHYEC